SRCSRGSAMSANSQHESDEKAQSLIDRHKEQASEHDHQQNHAGRDQRLAPRRPDDLRGFGTHLLDEFERIGHFRFPRKIISRSGRRKKKNSVAHGHKNSRRGTSRPRATTTSYRIARQLAKKNMTKPVATQNLRLLFVFGSVAGALGVTIRHAKIGQS